MGLPVLFPPDCLSPENVSDCTIEASVVTGFERVAKDECFEKFGSKACISRGRIIFQIPKERASEVLSLRSVDNVYVVIKHYERFGFPDGKEESLLALRNIVQDIQWEKGLEVWKRVTGNNKELNLPTSSSAVDVHEGDHAEKEADVPKFRATCYRTGENHSFGSPDAAANFGGEIFEKFHWKADMTDFDIEVVLNINCQQVYICLALTKQSLHKRNLTHFGFTSLRATIAYNMLRLAHIQPGDIVCDPMCGSGAIPVEGSISWPNASYICGDLQDSACEKSRLNFEALNVKQETENRSGISVTICKWDVRRFPLKTSSIDAFVTDMPFGKRSGSRVDNRQLYPSTLKALARASRLKTGRAVLLTQDKRSMQMALQSLHRFWKLVLVLSVNIGGLAGNVYILNRTAVGLN